VGQFDGSSSGFAALQPSAPPQAHSGGILALFLWCKLAVIDLPRRDIDHALCPLVEIARVFGELGHL
jgi:hypothetical protein